MKEIATNELARARAARIRAGIQTYLHTLADIAAAYAQDDWKALGYKDWQSYIDGEYSEHRLKLTPEHRRKAVEELRLAGMSTRAIAGTLGVNRETVMKDARQVVGNQPPAEIIGTDGKTYAASRPSQPAAPAEADAQLVDDGARTTDAREAETGTAPVEVGDGAGGPAIPPAPQTATEARGEPTSVDVPGEEGSPISSVRAGAAPVSAPRGADTGVNPSDLVNAALDKHVPDPNPHREWQRRYFEAIAGVHKVMRFTPEDVAEKADEECVDELVRVSEQFDDYRTRVIEARMSNVPDNVRQLRRSS